ncbi:uncharacterized protein METZ01_LOCUS332206, partial [marine metagenome]
WPAKFLSYRPSDRQSLVIDSVTKLRSRPLVASRFTRSAKLR